jgi:hypothetical protein
MPRNTPLQRAYVNDGRLVYEKPRALFSWLRFGIITSILVYLYVKNPANQHHRPVFVENFWKDRNVASAAFNKAYEQSRTTNFAFFCIKERTIQAIVSVGGMEFSCPYEQPIVGVALCQNILRNHMTHQNPVVYKIRDRVYTAHRIMAWLLIACALLSACHTKPLTVETGFLLVDSFASLFFDTHSRTSSSVWSLAVKLLHLNALIYPVLQAMDVTVQQQSRESIFASFKSPDANFALSIAVQLWIAVLMNAGSKSWSGAFLLQFDAVTAVFVGYYAHYQTTTMVADTVFFRLPPMLGNDVVTWNTLTWTLLFIMVMRGSVVTVIFWCLTHCAGQMLSDYQYEHLAIVATARALSNWIESVGRTMEQALRNLFAIS